MKLRFGAALLAAAVFNSAAAGWNFEPRIAVTGEPQSGVFHHLDGAGRKHLAVSGDRVAAVWEDNRSGAPQVYVATKSPSSDGFARALLISSGEEAYEPGIAALDNGNFILAWEQDGAVFARLLVAGKPGEAIKLSRAAAGHVSLARADDKLFAAWRARENGLWFLRVARLKRTGNRLQIESSVTVEQRGLKTRVLLPSLAADSAGICIAWEDRRAGHTRLLLSYSQDDAASFGEPQNLNEFYSGRNQYDQGNGVTRVSLTNFGDDEVLAAWMDKRRGGAGYGIFAALGGGDIFGPNEKVHGNEGDQQPHYNPATAGNARGDFIVAWDDFRRGDSDIWLSGYNDDDEWGSNFTPPEASGAGEQSHPSLALDRDGNLHLLWMERGDLDAPSRLWYSRAAPVESQ